MENLTQAELLFEIDMSIDGLQSGLHSAATEFRRLLLNAQWKMKQLFIGGSKRTECFLQYLLQTV